ncbi:MAG: hypothetical protein ACI3XS_05600 [Eubacteriales bacterium]
MVKSESVGIDVPEDPLCRFAEGKTHYPQDNFTYKVNFTCPRGKFSRRGHAV